MDLEPLSRYCRQCCIMTKSLQDNEQGLVAWKTSHQEVCKLNFSGTAPAMEPEGAKRIFERSIQKRAVRYMKFYGDGESKAFNDVQRVEKQECIGHYQKRVGSRLRKLKKREKGLKELSEPIIDKLQNYFGIALRSYLNTVEQMQNAIWPSFFHVSSSEKKNFHYYCEISSSSWCQYQRDQINDTNFYKPGQGLSQNVIKAVKPIYLGLINPVELDRIA